MPYQDEEGNYRYKDGILISEHPSEKEILDHMDEYMQFLNAEQREVYKTLRNSKICGFYKQMTLGKSVSEAIDIAIKTWYQQYPWEVKSFLEDLRLLRDTQYNVNGFSKDKSMMLVGRMPSIIKNFLITYDIHFFDRDKNGRCANVDKFYNQFKVGKI